MKHNLQGALQIFFSSLSFLLTFDLPCHFHPVTFTILKYQPFPRDNILVFHWIIESYNNLGWKGHIKAI